MAYIFIIIVPILCALDPLHAQNIITFDAANVSVMRNSEEKFNFANFAKHDFKYLNVEPVEVFEVNMANLCLLNCLKNVQCISYNLARSASDASGRFRCEILKEDMFRRRQSFVDSQDFSHFSLQVVFLITYSFHLISFYFHSYFFLLIACFPGPALPLLFLPSFLFLPLPFLLVFQFFLFFSCLKLLA